MLSLGCSLLLVRLLPRHVLLASVVSRAGFSRSIWRFCLLSVPLYRRIAWLPARSTRRTGRIRVAFRFGFASVAVACCLPWLAVDVAGGGVSLVGLARCRRVDGVGCLRDFRRPRCLPWVILSDWRVSLVPVACFALVVVGCRHGLIVVGCCRRGFVSSSVVVARRRFALLALGCRRHSCSPRETSAVDRLVDRFTARLLSPSCLSCGGTTGVAGSLVPLCDPLLGVLSS